MSFESDMRKAGMKITGAVDKTIQGAAIELFSEIVRRTPVGNPTLWKGDAPAGYVGGRLRGNWQAEIDFPLKNKVKDIDPRGAATTSKGTKKIKRFNAKRHEAIYFTNNLPYAERVEQGWSKQRPQGMVRSTVKVFQPLLNKIARINKI